MVTRKVAEFVQAWRGKGDEKQDTQRFWIELLHMVLGVENPAHQENDKAVMEAYGFKVSMSEPEIVAELFKLYQGLTKK